MLNKTPAPHRFTATNGLADVPCPSLWAAWDAAKILIADEKLAKGLHLRSAPYSLQEANFRLRDSGVWIEAVSS